MNFYQPSNAYQPAGPSPQEVQRNNRRSLRRLGNGVGFAFVALTLTSLATQYAISFFANLFPSIEPLFFTLVQEGEDWYYSITQFYSLFVYVIGFVVAILVGKAITGVPAPVAFPLRKVKPDLLLASIPICLGAIEIGAFMTQMLSSLLLDVTTHAPEMPDFGTPVGTMDNILYFINIAVAAAILEEFLCRGVILQSLRHYGDNFALIISSLAFGLMHGNLAQAPYAMVVGLVMGYFVLYTGSLWPAMIAHFINNGMGVVQTWISAYTTVEQDYLISSGISIAYVVLGLVGIIYLRKRYGSLFYVKRDGVPMKTSSKYVVFFTSIGMILFVLIEGYNIFANLTGFNIWSLLQAG